MSNKRILSNMIDTNREYEVIGLDLAKNGVSAVLIDAIDGDIQGIDRLNYDDLLKSAQAMSPTTFAMEPCTGIGWSLNWKVEGINASSLAAKVFRIM